MLKLMALILAGAWLMTISALAQDQDGETMEQPVEQVSPEAPDEVTVPQEVIEFLQDQRPASELSDAELGQRATQARQLSRLKGLSPQQRSDLRSVAEQLRAERQARMGAKQEAETPKQETESAEPQSPRAEPPSPTAAENTPSEPSQAAPRVPPDVTEFLADKRPPGELTNEELGQRSRQARKLMAIQGLDNSTRREVRDAARALQSEQAARQQQAAQPAEPSGGSEQVETQPAQPPQPGKSEPETAETVAPAPPEIEQQARRILADEKPAERLSNEELSGRLKDMRSVLEEPGLSKKEQRALRKRLQADREVLRTRMAKPEPEPEAEVPNTGSNTATGRPERQRERSRMDTQWATRDVLRDRRSADGLETGQLRRRLSVYRDAMANDQYAQEERDHWRSSYERDRRELRRRMFDQRRDRAAYWDEQRRQGNLDIDINIGTGRDRGMQGEIWADEVDDEEIEEQLLAAPRRQVQRRYSIEDFEDEPDLREVMPGVEIDTIRFGFNEAFVREEEIDNLDRIAETVEKILAARPGEVFLIEGHTDAVGSDAYNLALSRQRAQAVKEALTTYYVIPARNLETIGYGERYLKIPTNEPEQENRRVGLRRVTPLVGELED